MAHEEALRIQVIKVVAEGGLSRKTRRRGFSGGRDRDPVGAAFEKTRRTAFLPTVGDRRAVLKPHRDWLLELRRQENDLTLDAGMRRLPSEDVEIPLARSKPYGELSTHTLIHFSNCGRLVFATNAVPIVSATKASPARRAGLVS